MKKYLLIVPLAASLIMPLAIHAQTTSTPSLNDIQNEIVALQQRVDQLQNNFNQLLTRLNNGGTGTCATNGFTRNLGVGSHGTPVRALQDFLVSQGFAVPDSERSQSTYGEGTASAVTGFQEKFAAQILTPAGLSHGTGFVGPATRAELNTLIGCTTT